MEIKEVIAFIIAKEKEWMQAWLEKDEQKFDDILADDFLLSSARGIFMNKQEWIQGALGPISGTSFEWNEIRVRSYENVAVVNAITSQRATVSGKDWSGEFMITDVWVNKNGKWQVVARHGTGPLNK